MIQDDLTVFLQEFGEPATANSQSVQVIFDQDYAPFMGNYTEGRSLIACIDTDDLNVLNLKHFDTIVIRSIPYRIESIQPIQDGRFTDLILSEP